MVIGLLRYCVVAKKRNLVNLEFGNLEKQLVICSNSAGQTAQAKHSNCVTIGIGEACDPLCSCCLCGNNRLNYTAASLILHASRHPIPEYTNNRFIKVRLDLNQGYIGY